MIGFALLAACSKFEVQFNPNDYTDNTLIAEAEFSGNDYQYIRLQKAKTVGDTSIIPIDDAEISVESLSGEVKFFHQNDGKYKSEIPFSITGGISYLIKISWENKWYKRETVFPEPVSWDTTNIQDLSFLNATINSPKIQYLKYEIAVADSSSIVSDDTLWNHLEIAAQKDLFRIPKGVNYVQIPLYHVIDLSLLYNAQFIKFRYKVISKDVGEYLEDLYYFINIEASNPHYQNPPAFFSNDGYGAAYGIVEDSLTLLK